MGNFLVMLTAISGLTLHIFLSAVFMAAGMWWVGLPVFILGAAIEMWLWERSL